MLRMTHRKWHSKRQKGKSQASEAGWEALDAPEFAPLRIGFGP